MTQRCDKLVLEENFLNPNNIPNKHLIGLLPVPHLQIAQKNIIVDPMDGISLAIPIGIFFLALVVSQWVTGNPLLQVEQIPFFVGHDEGIEGFGVVLQVEVVDPQVVVVVVKGEVLEIGRGMLLNLGFGLQDLEDHSVGFACC